MFCDVKVIYVSCVNKLYFPRTLRLYSFPRAADKGLVNIYFFELVCKSMSLFKCILYFKEIEKDYERFLVKSKKTIFDVNVALAN